MHRWTTAGLFAFAAVASPLFCTALLAAPPTTGSLQSTNAAIERATNTVIGTTNVGPAVFSIIKREVRTAGTIPPFRLQTSVYPVFKDYAPGTVHHAIWTNVLSRTNGRQMEIWARREHPAGWPATAPVIQWNTNGLMWGMRGLTGLSPCWDQEGSSGQVPITALSRRHGYTRGHGMGAPGFRTQYKGKKVWFVTPDNKLVTAVIKREVVRTVADSRQDYTIVLFTKDLPAGVQPLRVATTNLTARYRPVPGAPWPMFLTEQGGNVSADIEGFRCVTWKGGDSGSPNLLPLPEELVFTGGRSTSGPSEQMQADMDELCRKERLDPKRYQLQWVNDFPSVTNH